MNYPSLDTVVELYPTARTRLLPPTHATPQDYTCLYISSFLTIASCFLSVFWVWEYGFVSSTPSFALALTTLTLLAFNAYMGMKAYFSLKHAQEQQYSEYVHKLSSMNTHEKLHRNCASPVWIERNPGAFSI